MSSKTEEAVIKSLRKKLEEVRYFLPHGSIARIAREQNVTRSAAHKVLNGKGNNRDVLLAFIALGKKEKRKVKSALKKDTK